MNQMLPRDITMRMTRALGTCLPAESARNYSRSNFLGEKACLVKSRGRSSALSIIFAAKPDISIDSGPGRDSILIGQVVTDGPADSIFVGKQAETPFRDVWVDVRGAHVLYVMGEAEEVARATRWGVPCGRPCLQ